MSHYLPTSERLQTVFWRSPIFVFSTVRVPFTFQVDLFNDLVTDSFIYQWIIFMIGRILSVVGHLR